MDLDNSNEVTNLLSNEHTHSERNDKQSEQLPQKKRKINPRIIYENLFKENILGNEEKDAEEEKLEQLVFGGESDILEQLTAAVPPPKQRHKRKKKSLKGNQQPPKQNESDDHEDTTKDCQSKMPVWDDEDDDNILVSEKANTYTKCHRSISQRGSQKYKEFTREKFLKISGNPEWADLNKKGVTANSDEDSEEELLQKTGNILLKSTSLPKTTIDIRKCQNFQSLGGIVKSVEFHPMSKVALVAGYSGTATLYQVDGKTNAKIQSVHFERFPISTAHFTTDGNEMVVGSRNFGHFFTYDMITGKMNKIPWEKGMEQMNVRRFHMSPDGKLMVVHGRHGHIHLLSARTKEWISSLKMNGEVIAITFNKDGSKMYSFGDTGEVYLWDMNSKTCIHKFNDEGCITGTSLALSPNNQYLACGSDAGVVNIYECSNASSLNPKPIKTIMNLTTEVTSMKFNHTSEILALASDFKPNALKLVHFPSMSVFSNFPTQERNFGHINSLDLSLNSGYLMFGNNKGNVYLYRLRHYANY